MQRDLLADFEAGIKARHSPAADARAASQVLQMTE